MANRQTVYKWIWVWNFEKEEDWLNEMALSGWVLRRVDFCRYQFERCEPGEYTIRMELHKKDPAYLDFMEENGAEMIDRISGWYYFRRKSSEGPFDIFSDIDSKISHLDRICKLLTAVGGANLAIGIVNSLSPANGGWINLLCATFIMYGLGRIHGKKESLERERLLHE